MMLEKNGRKALARCDHHCLRASAEDDYKRILWIAIYMVIYMLIIIWEVVICSDDEMNEGDLPSPRTMGTQSQTTCTVWHDIRPRGSKRCHIFLYKKSTSMSDPLQRVFEELEVNLSSS